MREAETSSIILNNMRNTIGSNVQLTVFGESHGPVVGVVLDGLAPGVEVDESFIADRLSRRRPSGATDTARVEKDVFQILSGVYEGYTTGAPVSIIIPNANVRSSDYPVGVARPSHADYTAEVKYHGFEDLRGGGHFSGRITAGIVAAGAICQKALEARNIRVATHILECAGVHDYPFAQDNKALREQMDRVESSVFPVIGSVENDMKEAILEAKADGDSVGGVIQTCIDGLPAGVGEPWFDSLESVISKAIFGIGGIKGIEFGSGFAFAGMRGSEANDQMRIADGHVVTISNHNGGINGGITNGMPIVFNMAVKPTPSISKMQETVDFRHDEEVSLALKGRHDPAIIRRICPVVTALVAVVACDALSMRFGTDFLSGGKKNG